MKFSTWSKLGRTLLSLILGVTIILGSVLTADANESQAQMPAGAPQISKWSVPNLHEGEKYGIFPISWYTDGTFQKPIDKAKFESLIQETAEKLDELKLTKKQASVVTPEIPGTITREVALNTLYQVLANYELPASFEMDKYTGVEYLQKKGIVNGTNRGLDLDQPVTAEQAAVFVSRLVEYVYETADGGAEGLLWKATHEGNTLYLLGSIHIGIPEMYPFQKHVKDAFEQADSLWVEANILMTNPGDMEYFTKLQVYNDGTTLKDHVSKETYEKIEKVLAKYNYPAGAFDSLKPWAINNNLGIFTLTGSPEEMSQAALLGVDAYLTTSALLMNKPVHELEGVKFQGDLFNNVPLEQQEKELVATLDSILTPAKPGTNEESAKQFEIMQKQWVAGDLEGFKKTFLEHGGLTDGSELSKRLLGERDKNMAIKLAELLEAEGSSTHFVVVGAAHLVTDGMVIDQLKQKGYTVEIVK